MCSPIAFWSNYLKLQPCFLGLSKHNTVNTDLIGLHWNFIWNNPSFALLYEQQLLYKLSGRHFSTPIIHEYMIIRLISTIFSFALVSFSLYGQEANTIFDEFYGEEVLEIKLETDLSALIDDRQSDDYQHAILTFTNKEGGVEMHDLKIKPRGKFRRRVCDFPPIKLNFSKDRLMERGYVAEYDKLKLVTHCLDDKSVSKENVAKEYLAYRLYNELTEKSYRTQLVRINYVDSKGRISRIKRYGVILEETDEMAHRAGGKECEECRGLPASEFDTQVANTMAVFQYMIGNSDYDMDMMRNLKMVRPYLGGGVIPVPYDFDFAGLVNPSYAIPNSDYGLVSVKQRVFLGHKVDSAVLSNTLDRFLERRSAMEAIVENAPLLNRNERNNIIRYLDTFYAEVDSIMRGAPEQQTLRLQALREVSSEAGTQVGK